jgi:hypothetical protein
VREEAGAWGNMIYGDMMTWEVQKAEGIKLPAQKLGSSAKRSPIEDEGCASEASSRRVGGPSRSELMAVGPTRLIIDPLSYFPGRGGWVNSE